MNKKSKVIIIMGASGTGKTVLSELLVERNGFKKVITTTTREKRAGEVDGVHYHFVNEDKIKKMESEGLLAEPPNLFNSSYYACSKDALMVGGNDPVLVILDPNGVNEFKKNLDANDFDISVVFLAPISKGETLKRLIERGSSPDEINKRLDSHKIESSWLNILNEPPNLILYTDYSKSKEEMLDIFSKNILKMISNKKLVRKNTDYSVKKLNL